MPRPVIPGNAATKNQEKPSSVTLDFSLIDLPTATHKAGLAGLLLLIESMRRRQLGPLPTVEQPTRDSCRLILDEASVQALFDDLYDATVEQVRVKSPWKDTEPISVEEEVVINEKTGKEKREKRYVYNQVVPKAAFLEALDLRGKGSWIKLWRDTIWGTVRSIPTTRDAYNDRAAGGPATRAGIKSIWPALLRWQKDHLQGKVRAVDIPGSLLLGSQDRNAEKVSFLDDTSRAFLLHFWPICAVSYVSQRIDGDGGEALGSDFAIAIPEVADIPEFIESFIAMLGARDDRRIGYRPADAVVSIPEEGGLELALHLLLRAQSRLEGSEIGLSISAVEVVHVEKKGNSLATLSHHRLQPSATMLEEFEHLRRSYRHPLLREQLIRNLVAGRPWYSGFARLAARLPSELFIAHRGGAWSASQFANDVRSKFRSVVTDIEKGED